VNSFSADKHKEILKKYLEGILKAILKIKFLNKENLYDTGLNCTIGKLFELSKYKASKTSNR